MPPCAAAGEAAPATAADAAAADAAGLPAQRHTGARQLPAGESRELAPARQAPDA